MRCHNFFFSNQFDSHPWNNNGDYFLPVFDFFTLYLGNPGPTLATRIMLFFLNPLTGKMKQNLSNPVLKHPFKIRAENRNGKVQEWFRHFCSSFGAQITFLGRQPLQKLYSLSVLIGYRKVSTTASFKIKKNPFLLPSPPPHLHNDPLHSHPFSSLLLMWSCSPHSTFNCIQPQKPRLVPPPQPRSTTSFHSIFTWGTLFQPVITATFSTT